MIISWEGNENFTIKTKSKTVKIGKDISLGELKINTPGEYESGGVQIGVIDGMIEILSERMTIAWMKKAKILSDQELEKINGVNVLILGVGGGDFSETKTALEVLRQIEPSVVIPMYKENLEGFLKEEGVKTEPVDQYKFTYTDLPADERKVVVLNPSA